MEEVHADIDRKFPVLGQGIFTYLITDSIQK